MHSAPPSNSPDSLAGSAGATAAFPLEPQALPWHAVQSIGRIRLPWAQALRIRLARMRRWEFWPSWVYYGPIVLWIVWLGIKHRSFTVFTACDPALDAGGLVGESKHQALQLLQANAPDLAATYIYVPADPAGTHGRTAAVLAFAQQHGFPVVLKPDVGLRGRGVYVARSAQQVSDYLSRFGGDLIVQRHIAGEEFGVFVARMPGQQQVRVLCGLPLGDPSLHTPAVMLNLLGDIWRGTNNETAPDWQAVLKHPGAHLHLYGKRQARAGRKMGHVTVCDVDQDAALAVVMEIKRNLAGK